MQQALVTGGASKKQAQKAADFIKQFTDPLGNEMAIGAFFSDDGRLRAIEAMDMTDPEAYRALYPKMQDMTAMMAEMQPGGGGKVSVEPDALSYGGQDIDRWKMDLIIPVPEDAPPKTAQQIKKMQDLVGRLVLGGPEPTMYSTFLDNTMVLTFGADSLGLLKATIDEEVSPLSDSAPFMKRVKGLMKDYQGVGYVSLTGLLDGMLRMARNAEFALPVPVQPGDLQFPDSPGIAMAYACSGNTGRIKVDVPAQELNAVVMGVQRAAMKVMQRMQKQQRRMQQQN
jgi:hypothetical protein